MNELSTCHVPDTVPDARGIHVRKISKHKPHISIYHERFHNAFISMISFDPHNNPMQ